MSISWEERVSHERYEDSEFFVRSVIDEAVNAVQKVFSAHGFETSNADPAEKLVAHIQQYMVDSAGAQ